AERTRSAARAIRVARVPALFPAADGRPAPRREHAARACLLPRAPALAALPADAQAHRAPVERTRPDAAGQCTDRSAVSALSVLWPLVLRPLERRAIPVA